MLPLLSTSVIFVEYIQIGCTEKHKYLKGKISKMNFVTLSDEQLEMVTGGSDATATATGTQSTTISNSTLSNGSLVYSYQVVGASADAHDITGSFNNNTLKTQNASGNTDNQMA